MTRENQKAGTNQGKRSLGNLLIDPAFQLKYTAIGVALVVAVSLPLAVLLHVQMTETVRIGDEAVAAGYKANEAARAAVEQATMLNRRLETEALLHHADQLDEVRQARKEESAKIRERAKELEGIESRFRVQRDALARQKSVLWWTIGAAFLLVVGLVAVGGIALTHRVAGPVFRMRRVFREVGDGQPSTFRPLRKHDELQDFFGDFWAMIDQLRGRQQRVLDSLNRAMQRAETKGDTVVPLEELREVRDELQRSMPGPRAPATREPAQGAPHP